MKKLKLSVLIFIIIMLFASCITRADIENLQIQLEDLESDYNSVAEEYESISEKIKTIENEIDSLSDDKDTINEDIENNKANNAELKAEIPVPPLTFASHQFAFHLGYIHDNENVGKDYKDKAWAYPSIEKNYDEITEEVYLLEGDIDTNEYLFIKYCEHFDFGVIYSIELEYSSDKYKDEYDDLVALAGPALIMIMETPNYYKDEYYDRGQEIIDTGNYMDGFIKLVREETENGEVFRIYAEN